MTAVFSTLGALALCVLGLMKYFNRKNREKRRRIDAADKLGKEGIKERDTSKIMAALNRLRRER